jgi:hypothetical protein
MPPTNIKAFKVGEFAITSGVMRVSDPSYGEGVWCSGKFKAVKGIWTGWALQGVCGSWGRRNLMLGAAAPNVDGPRLFELAQMDGLILQDSGIDVGVDSGSCGLFENSRYHHASEADIEAMDAQHQKNLQGYLDHVKKHFGGNGEIPNGELWHHLTAAQSLGEPGYGAIPQGIICSAGYGDGSYKCLLQMDGDQAVGAVVVFIDPKEDVE